MDTAERIAFIGTGAMGGAWMRGLIAAGLARPDQLVGSDPDRDRLAALVEDLGISAAESNVAAINGAQLVVLAVKPWVALPVMQQIGPRLVDGQIIVTIAAGVPLARLQPCAAGVSVSFARAMPNTPALVREGASAVAFAPETPTAARARVLSLLGAVGEVVEVEERLLDAVTGLSGSGPAYVFLMIEALADGGVAAGLPRSVAHSLALQTVLGAAALLKKTGQHPAAAKDQVATPGGTTIAGLTALEEHGVRAALIDAVQRAAERSRELSR